MGWICFYFVSLKSFTTASIFRFFYTLRLWFAFILYLWNRSQQQKNNWCFKISVVICFYFVSLKSFTTADTEIINDDIELWFAFILYLWNRSQQHFETMSLVSSVVICFYFVSLKSFTTAIRVTAQIAYCCDLLLFCIFEIVHNSQKI